MQAVLARAPSSSALDMFSPWAIEEGYFNRTHGDFYSSYKFASAPASTAGLKYERTTDGIAIIRLHGTLMKGRSRFGDSTVELGWLVRDAANDKRVQAILLHVESHGGTIAGTQSLANEVVAAGRKKPVEAFIEDVGLASAYWVASQASKLSVNATGLVGSIGTFLRIVDSSDAARSMGHTVHVIRSGTHKGAGVQGTIVTPEHLAHFKTIVNGLNAVFINAVAAGRKFGPKRASELSDGRILIGQEAKKAGLVDAVQSLEETYTQLVSRIGKAA